MRDRVGRKESKSNGGGTESSTGVMIRFKEPKIPYSNDPISGSRLKILEIIYYYRVCSVSSTILINQHTIKSYSS